MLTLLSVSRRACRQKRIVGRCSVSIAETALRHCFVASGGQTQGANQETDIMPNVQRLECFKCSGEVVAQGWEIK